MFIRVEELRDSTAHAEMICIREASNALRTWRLAVISLLLSTWFKFSFQYIICMYFNDFLLFYIVLTVTSFEL